MNLSATDRPALKTALIAASLGLLVLCCPACRKSPDPMELALQTEAAGPPPSAANVVKIDNTPPPVEPAAPAPELPAPVAAAAAPVVPVVPVAQPPDGPAPLTRAQATRHWLMLVCVLIVMFLLSMIIFHTMGRRLRQKSYKAHPPTRHTDIWAAHKPPEFLDP